MKVEEEDEENFREEGACSKNKDENRGELERVSATGS